MKYKNKKFILIFLLIVFISIGFAYLTANLSINGTSIIKRSVWDVHFENLVDDSEGAELNIPAHISTDKKRVDFEVTLSAPSDIYYFYVDVVNNGTMDVMLDSYSINGITQDLENLIETKLTYADGISLNRYDLLRENQKDTLKVEVKYKDNVNVNDLPNQDNDFTLSLTTTYNQADENAHERDHNNDTDSPVVKVKKSNTSTLGNNRWYKNLLLTTKLIDYSGIKSAKYCVTTEESCAPNTEVELENNSFEIQLENSIDPWTMCIESTDNLNNTKEYCDKNKYYVDGEDPEIKNLTVTPEDLSMTIQVEAEDNYSGVVKYYYSKDGGESYVSSTKPNYTFTALDSSDYIVMTYVEDAAGNTSIKKEATTTVREYSWCEKNDITNLGDCAIATAANNSDLEAAKAKIEAKGTPNFNNTSPTYTYKEKISSNLTEVTENIPRYRVGTGYQFDSSDGKYTLKNYKYDLLESFNFNDGNDYYLFSNGGNSGSTMYKVKSVTKIEDENGNISYKIKKYDYTYDIESYDVKGLGMYATPDDLGTSYYYRGSVGGNFVKFAGMYWRIIRINGDGSIRLIYFGDNTKQGSETLKTTFSPVPNDPTYYGFMNNESGFSQEDIVSNLGNYILNENSNYYFAKGYSWNESTKRYTLTGSVEESTMTNGVWKNDYSRLLENGYLYTCFSTSSTGNCRVMFKIDSYKSTTEAYGYYISHSSISYEDAVKNVTPSNIMTKLNSWYSTNIKNKQDDNGVSYSEYISDGIFCNDRSLSKVANNGNGYSLVPQTTYSGYDRLSLNKNPSLICPNTNDKFTQSETLGNGALKDYNPIGLITADEVAFAGGVANKFNKLYYLNYQNNTSSYTLTPSGFGGGYLVAFGYKIGTDGNLFTPSISTEGGARPVINLKSNIKLDGGDGTAANPFNVKITN